MPFTRITLCRIYIYQYIYIIVNPQFSEVCFGKRQYDSIFFREIKLISLFQELVAISVLGKYEISLSQPEAHDNKTTIVCTDNNINNYWPCLQASRKRPLISFLMIIFTI